MDYLHYVSLFDMLDSEDTQGNQRKTKSYKNRFDPFDLDDKSFKSKYRFTKAYARKIIDLVKDDIKKDKRGGAISPELQVLTALRSWARQEIQDDTADLHGISQLSVTNICRREATSLASQSCHFIHMPSSLSEQEEVIQGFRNICGFRNVIGAIDCTHVKIRKVGGDAGQYYVNRKGYYSMNVQVVCDSTLRIRDIVARWRGSTHDARIFRESSLNERLESGHFQGILLGDSGYPLKSYLFTPFQSPSSQKEEAYNRAHIHTRNTVERCFGLWKQRFRCLLNGFTVSLANVKLYIIALAILHNIAIDMGEELEDLTYVLPSPQVPELRHGQENNEHGRIARRVFVERYF